MKIFPITFFISAQALFFTSCATQKEALTIATPVNVPLIESEIETEPTEEEILSQIKPQSESAVLNKIAEIDGSSLNPGSPAVSLKPTVSYQPRQPRVQVPQTPVKLGSLDQNDMLE